MVGVSLLEIRNKAVLQTLFPPVNLSEAMDRMGFVQIDPIRSPVPAQDLILRHRVLNYKSGDITRSYRELEIEEDILYAYGYVTHRLWQHIHPRKMPRLTDFEKRILETIEVLGEVTASDLDPYFGNMSGRNDWGGQSRVSKIAMERLHRRGLLRVAARNKGKRIYEVAKMQDISLSPKRRFEYLFKVIINLLAPAPKKRLRSILSPVANSLLGKGTGRTAGINAIDKALKTGFLTSGVCEGMTYVWPTENESVELIPQVRILAPFDPLVWCRDRFEHLWGWKYRFEAYTPKAKRIRGYYAMPLLWKNMIIGWSNIQFKEGQLDFDLGYVNKKPDDKDFTIALEAEINRFKQFITGDNE